MVANDKLIIWRDICLQIRAVNRLIQSKTLNCMEKGRSVCTAVRVGSLGFRKMDNLYTDYKAASHCTISWPHTNLVSTVSLAADRVQHFTAQWLRNVGY